MANLADCESYKKQSYMNTGKKILLSAMIFMAAGATAQNEHMRRMNPVNFSCVKINDAFWSPRLDRHMTATLPVCIDQIENKTGRMNNFVNAANGTGEHSGIFFDDSDVYKAIEGMAYALTNHRDAALEKKTDEWIDKICAAQQPDGYLYTFYTINGLQNRWTDMNMHEMYCAGHMIEAAVAYKNATGKRKFLDTVIRFADHLIDTFGPGKRHWVPGHEEIELALVKLYDETGDKKYLEFSNWLINERGHGHGVYQNDLFNDLAYDQDAVPVEKLYSIGGHSVRAMYLFCGMADVAALTGNKGYVNALDSLWEDVVHRNMYITGGIGSSGSNEGFSTDYDLPNEQAYCETCASVGMVLWNWRMNLMTGDAKYVDVLERAMYNGALAGTSLSGDRFFYVNPLYSKGGHHRQEWFGCACCPSQISRFLPSIGNYIYALSDDALWINLFISGKADIPASGGKIISISQDTGYPWKGNVSITLGSELPAKQMRIRIPEWAKSYTLSVNGKNKKTKKEKGYAVISRKWKAGDRITLTLPMETRMTAAHPLVKENTGKRAVERGPIVYCIEQNDNTTDVDNAVLTPETEFTISFTPQLLDGAGMLTAKQGNGTSSTLHFTPYYAWDNREPGKMAVWIKYNE